MKKKILVIEDDFDVSENISELLTEEGYDVIKADNGIDGLTLIKVDQPDLIICDIAIPGLNGLDLLRNIHDEKINRVKPFIFLSAKSTKEDIRIGMNLGADDYLTKPYTRKEILDAVSIRIDKSDIIEEKNVKLRESIAYSLPHELNTPLNTIYLASEILRDGRESLSNNEYEEYIDFIHSSAKNIHNVLTKYLFLLQIYISRADDKISNNFSKEICNIPANIIRMIASTKAVQYGRTDDIKVKAENSLINIADSDFTHIITEILDNAFKFSAPGCSITVQAGKSFSEYLLTITNTGSSMSESEISLIGEFMQFGRKNMEVKGLGLGLFIVKSICDNYRAGFSITSNNDSLTINCRFKIWK